jgi:diacylglycerol kinase family enzyme
VAAGLLIVNPFASGVDERLVAAVAAALPPGVETVRTERRGEATELTRDAVGSVDAIYVYAGDGTYNEVLNGIDSHTPLGLVPGGGTSVLPRALGLPRDPVAAARRIAAGGERRIGLGRVNGRRFGFSAGIGLDAELVRAVDRLGRKADGRRPGDLGFVLAAARLLATHRGRFDPVLELEGLGRAAFVLVANCTPYTYLGRRGLAIAPEARFELGLDVVAPVRVRARTLPRLARYALLGRGQRGAGDVLYGHDLDLVVVRADRPMPLQVDGEDLCDVTEAVLEAERDAVIVLV